MGTAAIASRVGATPSFSARYWPIRCAVAARDHVMSRPTLGDGAPEQPLGAGHGQQRGDAHRRQHDSPKMVTLPGSPPKAAMFSCTHSRAAIWSSRPRLAFPSPR